MGRNIRSPKGNTAAAFLAVHDDKIAIPAAIQAAFKAMKAVDPTQYLYEADFCREAKVSTNKIGPYREQFAAHIIEVPGRDRTPRKAWFADVRVAAKVRAQLARSIP